MRRPSPSSRPKRLRSNREAEGSAFPLFEKQIPRLRGPAGHSARDDGVHAGHFARDDWVHAGHFAPSRPSTLSTTSLDHPRTAPITPFQPRIPPSSAATLSRNPARRPFQPAFRSFQAYARSLQASFASISASTTSVSTLITTFQAVNRSSSTLARPCQARARSFQVSFTSFDRSTGTISGSIISVSRLITAFQAVNRSSSKLARSFQASIASSSTPSRSFDANITVDFPTAVSGAKDTALPLLSQAWASWWPGNWSHESG